MTEYVFRPLRAGVRSRLFSGRYTLTRGESPRTVALGTPDKLVATKRLRDIIVQKQREQEGLVTPAPLREAAAAQLTTLLAEFVADLNGRKRSPKHARDTATRCGRILRETGWNRLRDIRADEFVKWRATLALSAKTTREYQAAFNSFLNWLVRLDRLMVNPLGKLDAVAIRGKQVRLSRSFSMAELVRLYGIAPAERRLVYQTLTYTGQRMSEVRALVWGDLFLGDVRPHVLFRPETMKDADKRALPLHPGLAAELRAAKPEDVRDDAPVFKSFPDLKTLKRDLVKAGIDRMDATGRRVHFHSFRKTFQTLGATHGVNQRAAQEMLGHSDANLTAKVYTDVAALGLHAEIVKLPWLSAESDDALIHSLSSELPRRETRFKTLCLELLSFSQSLKFEDVTELESSFKWRARRDSNASELEGEGVAPDKVTKAVKVTAIAIRSLLSKGGQR